jgi:hypothetical protein
MRFPPLFSQDMASWSRDGIAGLQSVVLYSLPELDGALGTCSQPLHDGAVCCAHYLKQFVVGATMKADEFSIPTTYTHPHNHHTTHVLAGAVDTVPLGGLVGDNIFLVPERVKKVAGRLKAWVNLRYVLCCACMARTTALHMRIMHTPCSKPCTASHGVCVCMQA